MEHHGLYGSTSSTSCCISQYKPTQWENAIFEPPQLRDPSTNFHETLNIQLPPERDPTCKISGGYIDVGGLGK